MAEHVNYSLNYANIFGMTLRSNGVVRLYIRSIMRDVERKAKVYVVARSKARHSGYPRTGNLARSIRSEHVWANQYGASRRVVAKADYALYVHEGTRGNGAGLIYARRSSGRFGGRFPVGRSQGRTTVFKAQVRGQRGNPFLADALREELRRRRLV